MSGVVAFIRRCVANGMSYETAMAAAEQFETGIEEGIAKALEQRRSTDRDRQQRHRDKNTAERHVTSRESRNEGDPLPSSLPPTPPNLTTKPKNPPIPPKPPLAAIAAADDFSLAWQACTDQMRKRAGSKTKAAEEWRRASKHTPPAELLAALRRYLAADPDVSRTGGPSFLRWLREAKFEAWLAGPDPPREPVTAEITARRLKMFADTGEWPAAWGERPKEQAA